MTNRKLIQAVDAYFTDLRLVRGSGGATDERSLYVPLANLLNDVGGSLRPKVFCVQELADQGAGHPDFNSSADSEKTKSVRVSPGRGVVTRTGAVCCSSGRRVRCWIPLGSRTRLNRGFATKDKTFLQ